MKDRGDLSLQRKYELIVETALQDSEFAHFFLEWEKYVLAHPDEFGLPYGPNNRVLNRTFRLHLVIKKWEEEGVC